MLHGGTDLPAHILKAAQIYQNAPELFGSKILINLPAGLVVTALTFLVFLGIKESKALNNLLVYLKIGIILAVILIGAFFVKPEKDVYKRQEVDSISETERGDGGFGHTGKK